MRPGPNLLKILVGWMLFALVVFAARLFSVSSPVETDLLVDNVKFGSLELLWWLSSGLLLLGLVFDFLRHRRFWKLSVVRELPHSLALGVKASVALDIRNGYPFSVTLDVTELYPDCIEAEELPFTLTLAPVSSKKVIYPVLPIKRGEARFGLTGLRVSTRWGLWQKLQWVGGEEAVKIYPNFAPIANSAGIGLEHQIAQMGVHLQQRRGEGSDFHQLREFREGDSLRQIDWKATSRQRKPISREYQDERDQDVVFMLDCGRRLRAKDDHISHFDHALNALLLTSYVALRQGDAVGMMSFAGDERWLAPLKGPARINTILNQLYDLHSSLETSDYLQAAEKFLQRNSKRALVILISNIRDEESEDLVVATELLSKKHIVMVASLREVYLDKKLNEPVSNFSSALSYCGMTETVRRRRRALAKLQGRGVIMTDSLPQNLHIELVNEYFKLKRSGRL
ncbi:DUF58 domain-containing protein [Teredinibacter haidensis]|uniref:DUF58 domain-containing protein n=1 Tax=Teredinibacter haidensis TaxID=2731755 RepID=UPI000A5DAA45|nr:DUF58 domain-containing protein [Teredinibacter haidensis]